MASFTETGASLVPFDPTGEQGKARFPAVPRELRNIVYDASQYLSILHQGLEDVAKSIAAPPQTLSYAQISYMPDVANSGLLQWPGIDPNSLRKVVTENIAPRLIINARKADIARYSGLSSHPWRPGWRIEMRDAGDSPTAATKRDIRDAERFIMNCNTDYSFTDVRDRDAAYLSPFDTFMQTAVSDTLTYDGWAIWTDMDRAGRVKAFQNMPASNIRLANPREGYQGDKSKFAALLDDTGTPVTAFTRDELVWRVRNPRTDAASAGYGWSEIEQGILLIQAYQNAIQLNADTFNRSGIPNGMLLLMGDFWNQDQIDLMMREWQNMKKGITKTWGVPVIAVPEDGDVKVVPMNDLKGTDVRYRDHMNMMMGALCIVYQFPIRRLGFFTSGHTSDSAPLPDEATEIVGADDPGLPALLMFLEETITQYLIWSSWPHLNFRFTNKDPKSDAREYEARKMARTWGESRAEADLPPLTSMVKAEHKEIAELLELLPEDPAKSAVYGSMVTTVLKAKLGVEGGDEKQDGARMQPKKDPAKSQDHGHRSGVRRDSAKEANRAASKS